MNSAFYTEFHYCPALAFEPGVTRRDPSPVIRAGGAYHVWYTKARVDASGYYGSVWHAKSADGYQWREVGPALTPGPPGDWDANGVFTPTILVASGRYYLFYTGVPMPFDNDNGGPNGTPTAIGVAEAASPDGPWVKYAGNPVLTPGRGEQPDSHRVDDACLLVRAGRFLLYYKGRQKGVSPARTKMCLATAAAPTGPYRKSPLNPVLSSGHEVCVWPHGAGVAALVAPCGPEGNTVQYSPDGLHFAVMARVRPPSAPGPYRADNFQDGWGPGVTWGLCHDVHAADRPFLLRFECDLSA